MFDRDIMDVGEKELSKIRELVKNKENCEKKLKELEGTEKEAVKGVEKKKKEVEKAISLKEREEREKVETPLTKVIEEEEKRKKEITEKRNKARKEVIDKEVGKQISEWKDAHSAHKKQIKKVAKEDKIPPFGNSGLFYALYYPKTCKDMLLLLVVLSVVFLVIPLGSYYLFWNEGGKFAVVCIYLVVIVVFNLLYIAANNLIKEKHMEAFRKINEIRGESRTTEQVIKEKIKKIEQKSDEELLGNEQSEEYKRLLEEIETALKNHKETKEQLLKEFDADVEAMKERSQKIWLENKPELDALQGNIDEIQKKKDNEKLQLEKIQNELDSEKYKPLQEAEKNIFKVKVLDELIGYLNNGEAKNIRLAIEKYKNPKGTAEKK